MNEREVVPRQEAHSLREMKKNTFKFWKALGLKLLKDQGIIVVDDERKE
jgi:hypothetical protein